jgi:hypothetical protein
MLIFEVERNRKDIRAVALLSSIITITVSTHSITTIFKDVYVSLPLLLLPKVQSPFASIHLYIYIICSNCIFISYYDYMDGIYILSDRGLSP